MRFPEYLRQWRVSIYLYIQQQDFPSIWAIWSSEYIFAYSRRMSRVSEPVECQDILINTAARFPEYLSQYTFKAYSYIWQQDFPSIWASTLSKHIPAYHRRQIPCVSEPVECQNIFLHMQEDFPSIWASGVSEHIDKYIQQDFPSIWASGVSEYMPICREDFPSIWASGVSEHIYTHRSKISRVSEPVHFQSIFLHMAAGFPEYLSQHTFKAYSCIS